jgi:hypothetical protein
MKTFLLIGLFLITINCNVYSNVSEKDTIISMLKEGILVHRNLLNAVIKESHNIDLQIKLRKICEDFEDYRFEPKSDSIIKEICTFKSKELIREYFIFSSVSSGSANELISDVLLDVYLCQPDFFIKELLKLPVDDYNAVLELTKGCFIMEVDSSNEAKIKDYSSLKLKLFELKPH